MLPLWIIDITKKSDRRDAFLRLVEQIDHVYFTKAVRDELVQLATAALAKSGNKPIVGDDVDTTCADQVKYHPFKDEVSCEDKRRATRNSRVQGDYWYYSSYELESFFSRQEHYNMFLEIACKDDLEDEERENVEKILKHDKAPIGEIGKQLYLFQEAMVEDAQKFIQILRKSNAKPSQPINIVVLGDAMESFTQLAFSSIAAVLQKEKGRFLAGHLHQGMSIIGMLYVPCNANALEVVQRERILRLFQEIEVQRNITTIRGYDNLMLYQDVQNRTECTYTKLDNKGLAEYLVQCLVHMYLACDINHPLLSGTGTDDLFYFSMGATSVYFDMSVEDKKDANEVAFEIVKKFKEEGDHARAEVDVQLFDKEKDYSSASLVKKFREQDIILKYNINPPRLHPIKDWLNRNLKQFYYQYYLRFYPAELLRNIMQSIESETNECLESMSRESAKTYKNAEIALPPAIERVISRVNCSDGGLAFVESKFRDMQEYFSKQRGNIQHSIRDIYWNDKVDSHNTDFSEYHDAYLNDIRTKNGGTGCNAMKQDLLKNLKDLLSREKTLAATLARTLLLSIICVVAFLPVLSILSPMVINIGRPETVAWLWALIIFAIPFVIQYVLYRLYLKKKRNLIRKLNTYFIHDAYARIANRVESEVSSLYDKLIALMDEYLVRCKAIRNEVYVMTPDPTIKLLFPQTMFNQPLNGGQFDGEPLIPDEDVERRQIKINGKSTMVNNLTREHYFVLISHFKDGFATLFKDVSITDSHTRRFNDQLGDYEFVSREEIIKKKAENWKNLKKEFNNKLHAYIKDNMCDRLYPTVGDMLQQQRKKKGCSDMLEYMIAMAATNGEFASHSDTEYSDVKANCNIDDFVESYLKISQETAPAYDDLYKRYLFITRWRVYKNVSFNRLLPNEDFDSEVRAIVNFEAEQAKREAEELKEQQLRAGATDEVAETKDTKEDEPYQRVLSSLFLWAVCPNDNSSEWLQLIQNGCFRDAYKERQGIRKIMNQDD